MTVPVLCPKCANISFAKSIDQLNEYARSMWNMWADQSPDHKAAYRELIDQLMTHNSPANAQRSLEEFGYVTMICMGCLIEESQILYDSLGVTTVRIGPYLFDPKFLKTLSKAKLNDMVKRIYGGNEKP